MEAAARIYTSIVFPNILSRADPHLFDLQKTMLDATLDCIKVLSVDGRLLTMNRAGCLALNVPQDSEFGMPWLSLLPEDVHQIGKTALQKAAEGHSARFHGRSESPDGLMYWDNLLTPLVDASGRVLSILCVSRDVTAKTKLEKELEESINREKLLSNEMQHRIKNLFSVVAGLISIAEKEAITRNTQDTATQILREKLGALSRASDAVFSGIDSGACDMGRSDLETLVRSVLRPYGDQCLIGGGQASIPRKIMTTFALFLHELATNSVKYGALSTDGGDVTIRWKTDGNMLDLTWTETGGPKISTSPERRGFGSAMVDRIVQSAGGRINRMWRVEGLVANLHLPIPAQD
ncbi:PAS domain-containing protein [Komagataeibacter medellinensis]|uniref:histidine kinase n=1 Tax=Komagataeibacter medellinensis TaxID=1177712 RepID=A0ABQ6VRS9_9PROT|nr:PAS domain-containing protein [Komagataeibacter medellinensis]KAB8122904.1 PAS domain-containing protein [Komagataeibacter medellinensis]